MTNKSHQMKENRLWLAGWDKNTSGGWFGQLGIGLAVFAAGLVMALYVLAVRYVTVHQKFSDNAEQAALIAGQRLATITVNHPVFGKVGLCDLPGGNAGDFPQGRTVSLNSLYATAALDALIAERLHSTLMSRLVAKDLKQIKMIEGQLTAKLYQAVRQDAYPGDSSNSIYHLCHQHLAGDNTFGRKLVNLSISIGAIDDADAATSIRTPPGLVLPANCAKNGFYLPYRDIPIPGLGSVLFYASADKITAIPPLRFRRTNNHAAPSAVLVEATYQVSGDNGNSGGKVEQVRSGCALVGNKLVESEPVAFMLNFPQGVPPQFTSISDMLHSRLWQKVGEWQQAIGANVPGEGSLGPPESEEPGSMLPHDALVTALYHWMRYAGCNLDPDKLCSLLDEQWSYKSDAEPPVNSCLVRESGARQYAILNQTGPQGAGQMAIYNAFSLRGFDSARPASALPLSVDGNGNVNLPGERGFDKSLVQDFFTALHATNLAGIESRSAAQSLMSRAQANIKQMERNILLDSEELNSLKQRREDMTMAQPPLFDLEHELSLIDDRLRVLTNGISRVQMEKNRFLRAIKLAQLVEDNGNRAIEKSYQICSQMSRLAAGGLKRVTYPRSGYLLSKRWIFLPHLKPVTEEDILDSASNEAFPPAEWLSPGLPVLQELPGTPAGLDPSPNKKPGELPNPPPATPVTIVLDTQAVKPGRSSGLRYFRRSPFSGVAVPAGQLFYFCEDALQSGGTVKVAWSALARDLVAFRPDTRHGDAPVAEPGWCRQSNVPDTVCPGLAVEFQVCAPVPLVPEFETDIYLSDPTDSEKVSIIPPVPSGMI